MTICRRRTDRSRDRNRDRDYSRDRSRDQGYTRDRRGDAGRAGGKKQAGRDLRLQGRDARGSQNDRARGPRQDPQDSNKSLGSRRISQSQPRDEQQAQECPVNEFGVLVSPDNIRRAKERRQIKNVKGEWLSPEDSGETFACCLVPTM